MTPTAVQTARWKGIEWLKIDDVRTTRALAAPMMPISAHNIHAGKKAPNNSKEGAMGAFLVCPCTKVVRRR